MEYTVFAVKPSDIVMEIKCRHKIAAVGTATMPKFYKIAES